MSFVLMSFKNYLKKSLEINSILDVDLNFCQKHKIQGLIFDFDGVLNTDKSLLITLTYEKHFTYLLDHLPIAIYSNAHFPARKKAMLERFPKLTWLDIPPKKPSPLRLDEIAHIWSLKPENLLMIDDRLLTGGLCAFRAGTQFAYLTTPLTSYKKHFFREIFFTILRKVEPLLIYCMNFK
jgi:predicted HAD superfamily phosphohydrolase YqeG